MCCVMLNTPLFQKQWRNKYSKISNTFHNYSIHSFRGRRGVGNEGVREDKDIETEGGNGMWMLPTFQQRQREGGRRETHTAFDFNLFFLLFSAQSDAPPSYDSIYGRIKAMKDSSDGNADFIQKAVKVTLCSTRKMINHGYLWGNLRKGSWTLAFLI